MNRRYTVLMLNLLLIGFGLCFTCQSFAATRLATNGKTAYVISLASDAVPGEKTAAEQLQKYLREVTGATFPVLPETEVATDAPQILVGAGQRLKALLPRQNWAALKQDGIVIKTVGNKILLAGGRPRGSLYAVYSFLEDTVGCRWWTPTENMIPRRANLEVPLLNVTYVPPFDYREHYTNSVQNDPVFATKLRENGNFQTQDANWGGHYSILGWWCHTFGQLLPVEKYFKEHPEWYSDPLNGNKPCTKDSKMPSWHTSQLCLSNPEVLDELTEQALKVIAKQPEAGYISISQNDNQNFCQDEESVALVKAEGSESAPILNFVNKVAARIHEKYPDFQVETLAYNGTEKPPKTIRPGKNVLIRLAPIWSDYGHPLNSEWNTETRDNLLGWAKIAPKLFVWNYITNFDNYMVTHPNWQGLSSDLRFFASNNVQGVFEQGDAETNGAGDFVQLRAWLMSKLLWNPWLDQDKLVGEFLKGYYGPAAPFLQRFLILTQQSYLAQNKKLSSYNRDFTFYTLDVANTSIQLFDQAEAAVKNDKVLLGRVQRERLSMELTVLYRYNALKKAAARQGKPFLGPKDPQAALLAFKNAATGYGVLPGASLNAHVKLLTDMLAPPVLLPEFARKFSEDDVIDLQPPTFFLNEPGKTTAYEPDAQASSKTAAMSIGDSNDWNIQAPVGRYLDNYKDKWRVFAMVRMERSAVPPGADIPRRGDPHQETPASNIAFQIGIYDVTTKKNLPNSEGQKISGIPVERMSNPEYQCLDLGVYAMDGAEAFVYFQPVRNPAVSKFYVDRVILVRQK